MARRRGLTPEDRRLWNEVAASATPLRPSDAVSLPTPAPIQPSMPPPARDEAVRPAPAPPGQPRSPLVVPGVLLDQASPHMDRRRFEKLRRGRIEPEARLDLHGMTAERAHGALHGFLRDAHDRGLRLVLVITGKGRADDGGFEPRRHGILRHSLPHWLAALPLGDRVLQVAPAHRRHGGAGAFYVYLRRRR